MSTRLSVSVVIPVLNGAQTIGDTLIGLMNQAACECESQIIVVDNGSTDGTRAIVQKFPVSLLCEPKRGAAAARNRGLYSSHADIIAYLDADTLPTRQWLQEIVAPFAKSYVHLVAGRLVGYRPETLAERYYSNLILDAPHNDYAEDDFPFVSSGNMAVRRSAALGIGGWDEQFLIGEDVDFSHRLMENCRTLIYHQRTAVVFLRTYRTMTELQQQAFRYGQGRAKVWLRYPEHAPWNRWRQLRMVGGLAVIGVWPLVARMARWVGYASEEDVEFAECHRAWSWWHWRGFITMMRHHQWKV